MRRTFFKHLFSPERRNSSSVQILVLGVTGPIASGKDEVIRILRHSYPVKVIDGDRIGHLLLAKDSTVQALVVRAFGKDILKKGRIDRSQLGALVFSDYRKLARLNQIMHPCIFQEIDKQITRWRGQVSSLNKKKAGVMIVNAALLHQIGLDRLVDEVWFVDAPLHLRLKRLVAQGLSLAEAKRRTSVQRKSILTFRQQADRIIENRLSLSHLNKQVLASFRLFLARDWD